jgi:hypothetical protein
MDFLLDSLKGGLGRGVVLGVSAVSGFCALLWSAASGLNQDTVVPVFALAAGAAAGVVFVWRSARHASLEGEILQHNTVVQFYRSQMALLESGWESDRKLLSQLRERLDRAEEQIADLSADLDKARSRQPHAGDSTATPPR